MQKEKFDEVVKRLTKMEKALRYLANDSHVDEPITHRKLYYALEKEKVAE